MLIPCGMAVLLGVVGVGMDSAVRDQALLDRVATQNQPEPVDVPWLSRRHLASARAQVQGRLAERKSDLQFAMHAYKQAVEADPLNGAAWLGLARLASKLDDVQLAAHAWTQRLRCCPDDVQAMEISATAAMLDHRPQDAASYLIRRRLAGVDESEMAAAQWDIALARALDTAGFVDEAKPYETAAKEVLQHHAATDPGDRKHRHDWNRVLQTLVDQKAYEDVRDLAATRLQLAPLRAPGDRGRYASVALVMDAMLSDDAASATMLESLDSEDIRLLEFFHQPMPPTDAFAAAGNIHATLGNEAGAARLYRRALELDPNNSLALNNLGYFLLEGPGHDAEAAVMIERAWSLVPDDPATLDSLGWLRMQQGRLVDDASGPGAVTVLRRASRLVDDQDPIMLEHLGDALWQSGDEASARRTWRLALAVLSHPDFREQRLRLLSAMQSNDWGVWVMPVQSLYDSEFEGLADRLRADLQDGLAGDTPTSD